MTVHIAGSRKLHLDNGTNLNINMECQLCTCYEMHRTLNGNDKSIPVMTICLCILYKLSSYPEHV